MIRLEQSHSPPPRTRSQISVLIIMSLVKHPYRKHIGIPNQTFSRSSNKWVECELCKKWRRVPEYVNTDSLDRWICMMNEWDPKYNTCDIPQEEENADHIWPVSHILMYNTRILFVHSISMFAYLYVYNFCVCSNHMDKFLLIGLFNL